jgi:hypothetical protein
LAETYWDLDQPQLAVETLAELVEMIPKKEWEAEYVKHRREAKKLLKKYREKMKENS